MVEGLFIGMPSLKGMASLMVEGLKSDMTYLKDMSCLIEAMSFQRGGLFDNNLFEVALIGGAAGAAVTGRGYRFYRLFLHCGIYWKSDSSEDN